MIKKMLIITTVITVTLALSSARIEAHQEGHEDPGREEYGQEREGLMHHKGRQERSPMGQRGTQGQEKMRDGGQERQYPTCGDNRQGKGKDLTEKLGLTEEQQEALREQREGHREKVRSLMESLRDKKDQLRTELEKEEVDKGKIDNLINEIKPLLGNQIELRVEGTLAMREILTPGQYEKFREFAKKKRKRSQRRKSFENKDRHGGFDKKKQDNEPQGRDQL